MGTRSEPRQYTLDVFRSTAPMAHEVARGGQRLLSAGT